jgi:hypothetical protein
VSLSLCDQFSCQACKLLKYGYRIDEVPVSYRPRTAAEGKKIRPWDGLHALWVILKYRFLD